VGLLGELRTIAFVFRPTVLARIEGFTTNPSASRVRMITGRPSFRKTWSGYETQNGAGTTTSSFWSTSTCMAV